MKKVEIYVPSDSEEEFDPQELVEIAKPPPSNFIWPPPSEEEKVPIAAPLYVAPPETQHVTSRPYTYRPSEKPQRLSVQNLRTVESQHTSSIDYECLNVESNITATTSTSNASSESEYKMYQTQNNHYANMFEQTKEVDDEVEEINQKSIVVDLRKTPPPIELPKTIKRVEFVEPEPSYKAETFSSVFSNRKETWQKLTSSTVTTKREERREEETLQVTDDNPDNSEVDPNNEEDQQVEEEENDVEKEVQGQHVGVHVGTYYQLAPSNIPQPIPRGYQSDFQKALITTSERPFHMSDVAPTPEPKFPTMDYYEEAVREAQKLVADLVEEEKPKRVQRDVPKFEVKTTTRACEFPLDEDDIRRGSLMSSMMRTASPKPMEFVKSNIIDEVTLPDEIDAYFPPPISMEPHEPYGTLESYRTKSPFVGALITGPDRPYTPFGREIMSQLAMELPQDTQRSFSNALHTAPDDSFNPSSLEYEFDPNPVEYTAKVYERIAAEVEPDEDPSASAFVPVSCSPMARSFLPKIQPWSAASDHIAENSYTDSMSGHESLECHVSESRRCSEFQRRRSSVAQGCDCDNRRCSEAPTKPISDLLKCSKVNEEEEFDPDKPNPNAMYPKRSMQPSPFEGMQMKITNKMTSSLHKPDEIPNYQRKWFNLPSQNPPMTPEPEELRENVPIAFHDWPTSANASRRSSISGADQQAAMPRQETVRASFTETGMSSKPPIPADSSSSSGVVSRRSSASDHAVKREEICEEEAEDDFVEIHFPTIKIAQTAGAFPTKGIRKNSLADLPQMQKVQFEKQRDLRHELHEQQQKMQHKQKARQQKELAMMQRVHHTSTCEELIKEEIQQNPKLSHYEMEQEYKRQLELEKQQRQKESELKEQQARELEFQRQLEDKRKQEAKLREKREWDRQFQAHREMEYQRLREEKEEVQRVQQEERDLELRRQQEDMEKEIRKQQEQERRDAERREAQRLFEIRRKEEQDRQLAKIEAELREKREKELRQLEQEIREKREQKQREEVEAEVRRKQEQKEREEAEREQRRLEEEAAKEQRERELKMQRELKWRQKQESDRKQREEMELFNIEEEKRRQTTYSSHTYQQQSVWPPNSKPPTPAPAQPVRQVPIIKTDSETELNATKFRFEPLEEDQRRFMAGIRPPSTSYSPPTEEKPFPSIPYYQQHLAFYEAEPDHVGIFNPKVLSPTPNRSRSPAFGPPPNPLLAFVNKTRDPELDESGIYLCGERLLSPIWYDKHHKQIPPAVQRKQHKVGSASRPPSKPDLNALNEAIKKHKQEAGTKPPPPPPPMPNQTPVQRRKHETETPTNRDGTNSDLPPKGIVASQIRRLSGDASNSLSLFPIRSSLALSENASENFTSREKDFRQNDFYDNRQETRQTTTNSYASTSSSHQLTDNNAQCSSQSFNQHFMGQSLASASFQNSISNPNSVDNVRVSTGSVGTPGAVPKHGRTFTTTGPNRGQGILTQPSTGRVPICGGCASQVRLVMGLTVV